MAETEVDYGDWQKRTSSGLSDTFQTTGGQSDCLPNHRWVMCNYLINNISYYLKNIYNTNYNHLYHQSQPQPSPPLVHSRKKKEHQPKSLIFLLNLDQTKSSITNKIKNHQLQSWASMRRTVSAWVWSVEEKWVWSAAWDDWWVGDVKLRRQWKSELERVSLREWR